MIIPNDWYWPKVYIIVLCHVKVCCRVCAHLRNVNKPRIRIRRLGNFNIHSMNVECGKIVRNVPMFQFEFELRHVATIITVINTFILQHRFASLLTVAAIGWVLTVDLTILTQIFCWINLVIGIHVMYCNTSSSWFECAYIMLLVGFITCLDRCELHDCLLQSAEWTCW